MHGIHMKVNTRYIPESPDVLHYEPSLYRHSCPHQTEQLDCDETDL